MRHCLLLLGALLANVATGGGNAVTELPAWQALEFEQQALWVTAKSTVTIAAVPGKAPDATAPDGDEHWQMTASSSVASNSEEVLLDLAARDGRALTRSRLGLGRKDRRYKSYDFLADKIVRERRAPGADQASEPSRWPLSSRREIPYPSAVGNAIVTDAYALLVLAGRLPAGVDGAAEVVVNTDFNFYRVRMSSIDSAAIEVNYRLAGSGEMVTGRRPTRGVKLQISPIGASPDKPDFSLLGLQEDITLLFDDVTGLPLQLRGVAPRVGRTEINLKSVTPRVGAIEMESAVTPPA